LSMTSLAQYDTFSFVYFWIPTSFGNRCLLLFNVVVSDITYPWFCEIWQNIFVDCELECWLSNYNWWEVLKIEYRIMDQHSLNSYKENIIFFLNVEEIIYANGLLSFMLWLGWAWYSAFNILVVYYFLNKV
jgi:hypothetical protein